MFRLRCLSTFIATYCWLPFLCFVRSVQFNFALVFGLSRLYYLSMLSASSWPLAAYVYWVRLLVSDLNSKKLAEQTKSHAHRNRLLVLANLFHHLIFQLFIQALILAEAVRPMEATATNHLPLTWITQRSAARWFPWIIRHILYSIVPCPLTCSQAPHRLTYSQILTILL